MDIKKSFGANVKKYRKALGYTQMQFAELIGVDQKHVSFIESGNSFPSPNLIAGIADKLKVAPCKLFEFEVFPSSEKLMDDIIYIIKNSTSEELSKIHNFASSIFIDKANVCK